ncbi:MAG: sensor histidine kinase KdpD [Planctomycetia bacterium]|nr:sensor histidine kinase KdpD [Planctomycetia bacterium]
MRLVDETRPDPEALLKVANAAEQSRTRGKLKVFFGAAPGVGKTFTMLQEARKRKAEGVDVVIGYVEPHRRPETLQLMEGIESIAPRTVEYRGMSAKEFDLDAALARRPGLILVDELAHTNVEGSRHAKRWQDVEELLAAGVDVFTTVNVQHLESLNDVVAQITGVAVRETVPDVVFEKADEVELVDLTPDELLERLREGKVYVPEQSARALQGFFRRGNLAALRELSLRRTADRVGEDVAAARRGTGLTWPTAERIMVAVGPSPTSAMVVRAARRLATAMRAEWIAVCIETPALRSLPEADLARLDRNMRAAERLGAEAVMIPGTDVVGELVAYARRRNVTRLVVGKTERPRWRDWIGTSPLDELSRRAGEIDVIVVRGTESAEEDSRGGLSAGSLPASGAGYAWALGAVVAATGAGLLLVWLWPTSPLANLAMLFLLATTLVAYRFGLRASVLAAILGVLCFDVLFVPPRWTFNVSDTPYFITFAAMLAVGLVVGTLTDRLRAQAEFSRLREARTEALHRMSMKLSDAGDLKSLLVAAREGLEEAFGAVVRLFLPAAEGRLREAGGEGGTAVDMEDSPDLAVAQWAFDNRRMAGRGTDTLPSASVLCVPLATARGVLGVAAFRAERIEKLAGLEAGHLLSQFARQVALAVERQQLAMDAHRVRVEAEMEKLRSALLSSVSHDLRTPLSVISGTAHTLLTRPETSPEATRALLQGIHDEAGRLTRLVSNLLDITRLESGAVEMNRQWVSMEEVIGSTLRRLDASLAGRGVKLDVPADLPLVNADGVLLEQLLYNLLENVVRYTPAGSPVGISAAREGSGVLVRVDDEGPGFAPGEETRVFEKFYRGLAAKSERGAGLGLSICRAITAIHGGRIWAANRPERGASVSFWIPIGHTPPPETPA